MNSNIRASSLDAPEDMQFTMKAGSIAWVSPRLDGQPR